MKFNLFAIVDFELFDLDVQTEYGPNTLRSQCSHLLGIVPRLMSEEVIPRSVGVDASVRVCRTNKDPLELTIIIDGDPSYLLVRSENKIGETHESRSERERPLCSCGCNRPRR
jgi:hypothetical protein